LRRLRQTKRKNIFTIPFESEQQAANEISEIVKWLVEFRGGVFERNVSFDEQVSNVAKWMTEGKKKCLVLCGSVGNGKTTMMQAIASIYNAARLQNTKGYVMEFVKVDVFDIDKADSSEIERIKNTPLLAIDDFGFENLSVKEYGNERIPMIEILSKRYDIDGITILTTNMPPDKIKGRYGVRIADRLAETATFIPFTNQTYRRK